MRPTIRSLALSLPLLLPCSSIVLAQGAATFRCDQGGQTVYRDSPCPAPASVREVVPARESDVQQKRGEQARDKLERDNAAIDQRLDARAERESKERIAAMKAAPKPAAPDTADKARKESLAAKRGGVRSAGKKSSAKKRSGKPVNRASSI